MEQTHQQPALVLIRGLPGSGKTTFAALISEQGAYPVFSVDDYFTDPLSGAYQFDYRENHLAYKRCEALVQSAMQEKKKKIIVHNTFTMEWEMEPYFKLAEKYCYTIFVLTMENRHNGENTHQISALQLKKMAEKFKVKLH